MEVETEPQQLQQPSQPDELAISILHGKDKYVVHMKPTATVAELQIAISQLTSVPEPLQKLIHKGEKLNPESKKGLEEIGIKNKAKIVLVGSTLEKFIGKSTFEKKTDKKEEEKTPEEEVKKSLCEEPKHQQILKKGIPEDAEKGDKEKTLPLPPILKGIINEHGEKVRLSYKPEISELHIFSSTKTEKIPCVTIKNVVVEPILGHEEYAIVGIQLGPTEKSRIWFYYVPFQYVKGLKYCLLGAGSAPFYRY